MTSTTTTADASWFAPVVDPAERGSARPAIDPLSGAVPTWRASDEPIYLSVVRDLGMPGSLTGPSRDVVAGALADPDRDPDDVGEDEPPEDDEYPRDAAASGPLTLVHTAPLPVVDEPAARPARKPRAPRKRAAS